MTEESASGRVEKLPDARSVLAVCAHPDDESFGLGAVLSAFGESSIATSVLCFTHGEASTLGSDVVDLGTVRTAELTAAAKELGMLDVSLLAYGDGHLNDVPLDDLVTRVRDAADRSNADLLLVFDEGGITGHGDHCRATEAAVAAARLLELRVLAWAMSQDVALGLTEEFGARFVGRGDAQIDFRVTVDRRCQRRAIARHVTQAPDNPVLHRRLELQGDREVLRWLHTPRTSLGDDEVTGPK